MKERVESEREKMIRGEMYVASDRELIAARIHARRLWLRYNLSDPDDVSGRLTQLMALLGAIGKGSSIEPPFHCDYGTQISLGADVFVNFGGIFLDPAPIVIGDGAQLGPGVQLLTADHPRDATDRSAGPEMARPITIGARAWIGGGVIVCPGVTIGADSTIGAGSVVVRDVPSGVVAAGNPCRVIRRL